MINPSEIAVLILSTRKPQYDAFKLAIAATWMRRMQQHGIRCYFYSGDHEEAAVVGDQIQLTSSDLLWHTSEKLLGALDLLLKVHPDVKLVYRTNLSSFIDVENFLAFVREKGVAEDTYSGVMGETTYVREYFYGNRYLHKIFTIFPVGEMIRFASGSGFFIGIRKVQKLLSQPLEHAKLIDDVMVAKALQIQPDTALCPLRFDITETGSHKVSASAFLELLGAGLLFHYRFKTSNRMKDAEMLKAFDDPAYRFACCTLGEL